MRRDLAHLLPCQGVSRRSASVRRPDDAGGAACADLGNREPCLEERALILCAILEFMTPAILSVLAHIEQDRASMGFEDLRRQRMMDRTWLPRGAEGRDGWVYFLTSQGAKLARQLAKEAVQRPRVDERASLFLNHRIAVSEATAGIMAEVGRGRLLRVCLGRRLRSLMARSCLRGRYVPDAYLVFTLEPPHEHRERHLFLEVDRDTETRSQLRRKFRALNSYYLRDHQRLLHTDRLLVAVTTPSVRRLTEVREVVLESRGRVRVVANLHGKIRAGDHALEDWVDCQGSGTVHLLVPDCRVRRPIDAQ